MEIFIVLRDSVLMRKMGLSISRVESPMPRPRKALIKSSLMEKRF
jgi:hypothetical protein